jgi:hypothetical protein
LGADFDVHYAAAFLPGPQNRGIAPIRALAAQPGGGAPGNFLLTWTGGVGPFQVQSRTNLVAGAWGNAGGLTCDASALFPLNGMQMFFRVLSLGDKTVPQLEWLGIPAYFQGAMNAVAQRMLVSGFGINDYVNLLGSGALPITVQRTIINNSLYPISAGYTVEENLTGWTFLAVGGSAGYVPGTLGAGYERPERPFDLAGCPPVPFRRRATISSGGGAGRRLTASRRAEPDIVAGLA